MALGLLALFCFSTANVLLGNLAELGMRSTHYYCSGSLFFSIAYFTAQKEWAKRNDPMDEHQLGTSKVLTRTWDNRFDWHSVLVVLGGAVFQFSIFSSIIYSF